eukprot:14075769-Heterocapsa_arctica.AAC.1
MGQSMVVTETLDPLLHLEAATKTWHPFRLPTSPDSSLLFAFCLQCHLGSEVVRWRQGVRQVVSDLLSGMLPQ